MSKQIERSNRVYPKSSYTWLLFRKDFLGKPWPSVKLLLRERRYTSLPKRFHEKGYWWWAMFWTKRYCDILGPNSGFFRIDEVKDMGSGMFADRDMKKGSMLLFGHLHRISQKTLHALDEMGESSLMQVSRGKRRIDWYYLGGPASLVNHACKRFNCEFILDEDDRRGANGEMLVRITKQVRRGEEVLANYGDEFWKDKVCKCLDCWELKMK
jgi:hypothetical protein